MASNYSSPMVLRTAGSKAILRVNREFTEELGWSAEELAGRPLVEWIHADDRARFEERLTFGSGRVRARHVTRGGNWIELEWEMRAHGEETVVLGLRVTGEAGEGERPTPDAALERSTMAKTLDSMARVVEAKNPGMRCSILLVDEYGECITFGAGPSLPDAYNDAVEGLRIGPSVGSCGTAAYWNVPVVVEDIARDPLWCELREAAALAGVAACWSHPITSMSGEVLGAMALYADEPSAPTRHQMENLEIAAQMVGRAVERDRLEEQLRRAMKMEAIGVLAGGIAHDFNNLLATVLGNAELVQETLAERSDAAPMLEEIVTASLTASDLCNQLLAYAGRGTLTTETVECNALVRELGSLLLVALSKKARLDYELHESPLHLSADRGQLRQVIMNMITNASDAIGNAEGRIVIGTSPCMVFPDDPECAGPEAELQPGEYVRLWVSDTGSGMSAKTQAKIFDPFFTTKPTGRGLGLAAVQGIVRGHRGAISLESEPGVGTTFSVLLPRTPVPAQGDPPADSDAGSTGGHVLVADDEAQVRKVVGQTLERAGYRVTLAKDGEDALELFRQSATSIDCVLLDLSMPKLDGEEVLQEMRRIRSDVPVVLSSGFAEQEIMDRFRGAGVVHVVHKPARRKDLLRKLAAAMAQEPV